MITPWAAWVLTMRAGPGFRVGAYLLGHHRGYLAGLGDRLETSAGQPALGAAERGGIHVRAARPRASRRPSKNQREQVSASHDHVADPAEGQRLAKLDAHLIELWADLSITTRRSATSSASPKTLSSVGRTGSPAGAAELASRGTGLDLEPPARKKTM